MSDAVENLAGVAFKTYHPSNMCADDWDSGAILGRNNSYREHMTKVARAILAAIQADPLAYWNVKTLEWGECDHPSSDLISESPTGHEYSVGFDGYTGWWSYCDTTDVMFGDNFTTIEDAQAAAQTDYENRLKECL